MATIGNLAVNITANTEKFSRGMKTARQEMTLFEKTAESISHSIVHLGTSLFAAFAVHRVVHEFIERVHGAIEELEQLGATARRLDLSTEAMGGLTHAAAMVHISTEQLSKSLTFMEKNVGKNSDALQKMGLTFRQLAAMRADDMFLTIAEHIERMPTAAEKTAAAMAVFGKSGAEMLKLINEAPGAIREMMAEAGRMGLAPSEEEIKRIEEADNAIDRLTESFKGLWQTIAIGVAGPLAHAADAFNSSIGADQPAQRHWDSVIRTMADKEFKAMSGQIDSARSAPWLQRLFLLSQIRDKYGAETINPNQVWMTNGIENGYLYESIARRRQADAKRAALGPAGPMGTFVEPGGMIGGGTAFGSMAFGMMNMVISQMLSAGADKIRSDLEFSTTSGPEFQRISNNIDELIAESRGPQAIARRAMRGDQINNSTALEQGTAAAFSQSRRSSQASSLLDVSRKSLDQQKEQTKALHRIDANMKATQAPVTVNIA